MTVRGDASMGICHKTIYKHEEELKEYDLSQQIVSNETVFKSNDQCCYYLYCCFRNLHECATSKRCMRFVMLDLNYCYCFPWHF